MHLIAMRKDFDGPRDEQSSKLELVRGKIDLLRSKEKTGIRLIAVP